MMNMEIVIKSEICIKEEPLEQVEESYALPAPEKVSTCKQIMFCSRNLFHIKFCRRLLIVC